MIKLTKTNGTKVAIINRELIKKVDVFHGKTRISLKDGDTVLVKETHETVIDILEGGPNRRAMNKYFDELLSRI